METNTKIKDLEEQIGEETKEILDLERELEIKRTELKLSKAKMEILIDDVRDEFDVGDKLLFNSNRGEKIIIQIIMNVDEEYDGLLLTNSDYFDYMKVYCKFDCRYDFVSSLINHIEVRYKLKFIKKV